MGKRASNLRFDELDAALSRGDALACLAFFEPLAEPDRARYAARLIARFRALMPAIGSRLIQRLTLIANSVPWNSLGIDPDRLCAAQIAVLASASLSQLRKLGPPVLPGAETACAVMAARRPPWLGQWAEFLCELSPANWQLVRLLVRGGLCQAPQTDAYIDAMLSGVAARSWRTPLRDTLLEDPDLLENEIWRIFEVEPRPGSLSILSEWKGARTEQTWSTALVQLAAEGKLSRNRLLDATLDGLHRDFHEYRARWFAHLHEALSPAIDERAERVERYASLLQSRNASTITFAVKSLAALDKANRLAARLLIDSIAPALRVRHKTTARTALKVLEGTMERERPLTDQAALVAAEALRHESSEVQRTAIDIIARFGRRKDQALRSLLAQHRPGVAPSQQSRIDSWLGSSSKVQAETPLGKGSSQDVVVVIERAKRLDPCLARLARIGDLVHVCESGNGPIPAIEFDGTEVPRLDPAKRLQPIADLDSLLELFAATMEKPGAADDFERILDGVSRLCDLRPTDFERKTGPLRARAQMLLDDQIRYSMLQTTLCQLALSWAEGRKPRQEISLRPSLLDFFYLRITALMNRVVRRLAAPLLSAPTHESGWIEPSALPVRMRVWNDLGITPDRMDEILALLRLAPDNRSQALGEAAQFESEFAAALRYALGSNDESIGRSTALWVAAARARAPFSDDPAVEARHPNGGPDAGRAARYAFSTGVWNARRTSYYGSGSRLIRCFPVPPEKAPVDMPSVALHVHTSFWCDADALRWIATVWPSAPDAFFAAGVEEIAGHEHAQMDAVGKRPYLDSLADPDVPFRPIAVLLAASALSAKHPDESLPATDALISAIEDGRLDGPRLGEAMAQLLPSGLVKPIRWAKNLAAAARVSPLHVEVIAEALQYSLRGDSEYPPGRLTWTNLQSLLELLKELLIECGERVWLLPTRDYMSRLKAPGRTARLVEDVLSLEKKSPNQHRVTAAAYALSRRIERVERWNRWRGAEEADGYLLNDQRTQ
jgi:hypothetical protein